MADDLRYPRALATVVFVLLAAFGFQPGEPQTHTSVTSDTVNRVAMNGREFWTTARAALDRHPGDCVGQAPG